MFLKSGWVTLGLLEDALHDGVLHDVDDLDNMLANSLLKKPSPPIWIKKEEDEYIPQDLSGFSP